MIVSVPAEIRTGSLKLSEQRVDETSHAGRLQYTIWLEGTSRKGRKMKISGSLTLLPVALYIFNSSLDRPKSCTKVKV
jgi:hypothetical protein